MKECSTLLPPPVLLSDYKNWKKFVVGNKLMLIQFFIWLQKFCFFGFRGSWRMSILEVPMQLGRCGLSLVTKHFETYMTYLPAVAQSGKIYSFCFWCVLDIVFLYSRCYNFVLERSSLVVDFSGAIEKRTIRDKSYALSGHTSVFRQFCMR